MCTVPIEGGEVVRLTSDSTSIRGLSWTVDGSDIVYSRGGVLWRISATGGEPRYVPVSGEDLDYPVIAGQGNLLAYVQSSREHNIWRMEIPTSKGEKNTPSKFIYYTQFESNAKYSPPDGHMITYAGKSEGQYEIFTISVEEKSPSQITKNPAGDYAPSYSADGNLIYIVFLRRPFSLSSPAPARRCAPHTK